jgi:hypothetical protein
MGYDSFNEHHISNRDHSLTLTSEIQSQPPRAALALSRIARILGAVRMSATAAVVATFPTVISLGTTKWDSKLRDSYDFEAEVHTHLI